MKRFFNFLINGIIILTMLGCSTNKTVENKKANNYSKTTENNPKASNYFKTIENISIEMNIPNEWKYEELPLGESDDYKYVLKLYKSQEDKNATLYIYNQGKFGLCGTGRTVNSIILDNGNKVEIGYYDNQDVNWSDIFLSEFNVVFLNHGLDDDEAVEFLDLVKTVNVKNIEN